MEFDLQIFLNVLAAVLLIIAAAVKLKLYSYLRTIHILLIAIGFVYIALVRIFVALELFGVIEYPGSLQRITVVGGYVFITIGSIGLFYFVRKTFADAVRAVKKLGVLPDKWKGIEEKVAIFEEKEHKTKDSTAGEEK